MSGGTRWTRAGYMRLALRTAPALSIAGALLLAAGCGGGKVGTTDEAVVIPNEPLASSAGTGTASTAAPANTGSAAPAASSSSGGAPPAAATGSGGSSAEGWGTLKGRVVFNGTAPEQKVIDTSAKDPTVCAKTPVKSQRLVVDPESKGVKYAIVYIPRPTKTSPEAESEAMQAKVVFDQEHCMFDPHVIALMKGAKITLKSSDPVNHNINAKLRSNSPYNQLLTANQEVSYDPVAAERGPIEVTCDIHPWMKAYWLITDKPYFAVTDDKGNFEIKNVPAGAQKVVVWQEAVGYVTPASGESVNVKAGEPTTAEFKVDPGKVKSE